MDSNAILQRIGELNDGYRRKKHGDTKDLTQIGWYQIDGGGLFYRSTLSEGGFAVDLALLDSVPVTLIRKYKHVETLDGASEKDLTHINDKLDELEIWMMLERV